MASTNDPGLQKLSDEIITTMRDVFKTPLNYRPARGLFHPSKDGSKLSKAPIFKNESTPLIFRFSMDTGFKDLPDNGENGSRGFAIRFLLSDDVHTGYDIVTNNAWGFIVSTGEGFRDQFIAQKEGKMDDFLKANPHAKYFQENQAPAHSYSFATEQWHSVQAFKFTNDAGEDRYFRWRIVPWQGVMKYSKDDAAKQSKHYQWDDLEWRLKNNKPIKYRLLAQLAEPGDPTNDSTETWPETNEFVELGEIVVNELWTMDEGNPAGQEQKKIFFNPVPHNIDGIDSSDDPLLKVRDAVYQMSAGIRRDHVNEKEQQAIA